MKRLTVATTAITNFTPCRRWRPVSPTSEKEEVEFVVRLTKTGADRSQAECRGAIREFRGGRPVRSLYALMNIIILSHLFDPFPGGRPGQRAVRFPPGEKSPTVSVYEHFAGALSIDFSVPFGHG